MHVFICLFISIESLEIKNREGGDMVSVIASGMAERGIEPRSGQTNNCKTGIFLVFLLITQSNV